MTFKIENALKNTSLTPKNELKLPNDVREASHIDLVHEKRHMDVGGGGGVGACDVSR